MRRLRLYCNRCGIELGGGVVVLFGEAPASLCESCTASEREALWIGVVSVLVIVALLAGSIYGFLRG